MLPSFATDKTDWRVMENVYKHSFKFIEHRITYNSYKQPCHRFNSIRTGLKEDRLQNKYVSRRISTSM